MGSLPVRHPRRLLTTLASAVVLSVGGAGPAAAQPFTVDSLGDGTDPACPTTGQSCTLRQTLLLAQGSPGPDVIGFSVAGVIELQSALPDLPDGLQIMGPGANRLDVSKSPFFLDSYRIFTIPSPGSTVSISGLTASNGSVAASGGTYGRADGGGIYNAGDLTLEGVVVRDNLVTASATGPSYPTAVALGGGIINDGGNMTLRGVTVSGNHVVTTADGPNAQAASQGGGIWSSGGISGGTLTISNSTITGNVADASSTGSGATQQAQGGGIQTMNGPATLTGATVTANSGIVGANISTSATTLRDTIISNPLGGGDNCSGGFLIVSEGYNLEDGPAPGTCGLTSATDLHGDPMLGPPAGGDNAPPYSLQAGSPAIDAGNSFGLPTDQLGMPRPSDFLTIPNAAGGDGADIGAFEAQAPPPEPAPPGPAPPSSLDTTPPQTTMVKAKVNSKKHSVVISFTSSEENSSFRCKLDRKAFKSCKSQKRYKRLKRGKHTFKVVATDASANADPTPAKKRFKIR